MQPLKVKSEFNIQKGIMYLCLAMQFFQSIYCYFMGIQYESLFCFISFLVQLLALYLLRFHKGLAYHLSCLNCILVIVGGNIHNSISVNASMIFFSLPPLICISLVGIKWGSLWSFFSVLLSTGIMFLSQYYTLGWGSRSPQLDFELALSNLFSVPLLVASIFAYFYYKKEVAEKKLKISNINLKSEKVEKERLLNVLFHDLGRNTSLLSGYLEMSENNQLSEKQRARVYRHTEEIKLILKNAQDLDSHDLNSPKEIVNLYSVYQSLRENYAVKFKNKSMDFIFEGDKRKSVECHFSHLQTHILGNLVSNAIKFSDSSSQVIFEVDNQSVKIVNKGIPFSSNQKKGTLDEVGSGIGLEIVKDYCAKNKFDFSIYSDCKMTTAQVELNPQKK